MRRYTPHQFIEEATRVHEGRYSYPDLIYVHAQEKVKISCPEHGIFYQSPTHHIRRRQGCPKCKSKSSPQCQPQTLKDFVSNARAIHGDRYDYSRVEYKNNHTPVTIVCREHGEFSQLPSNHTNKTNRSGCPTCAGLAPWMLERFLSEAKEVHGDTFDYSLIKDVRGSKDKLEIICKLHGKFSQSPTHHIQRRQGCPECAGTQKGSTEKFIQLAREIHGSRYIYDEVVYVSTHKKVRIICPTHGAFEQRPSSHTKSKNPSGCPDCACTQWTTARFIERAQQEHGSEYDYSESEYSGLNSPVRIICRYHGPFAQRAGVHLNGSGCPRCRNSYGHAKIQRALSAAGIPYSEEYGIREQDARMPLWLDFAIIQDGALIAAVEYHGEQHFRPVSFGGEDFDKDAQFQIVQDRDERKRAWCKSNNVPLLEIPYKQLEQAGELAVEFASPILGSLAFS